MEFHIVINIPNENTPLNEVCDIIKLAGNSVAHKLHGHGAIGIDEELQCIDETIPSTVFELSINRSE